MSSPLLNARLLSLAREQLSLPRTTPPHFIPNEYLEELKKHVGLYPNDTNFLIKREPGRGLGHVVCLETGCNTPTVKLVARLDLPDGGVARGYGSLSSYRVHVAQNLRSHQSSQKSSALKQKQEPALESTPVRTMLTPSRSVGATLDQLSLLSSGLKPEPRYPRVKFEPSDPVIPMKRLSNAPKQEDNLKRVKFENDAKMPPVFVTNSPSSSPSRAFQNAVQVRSRLSDIQSQISINRRLLDNVQRKTRKTPGDRTREARFFTAIQRLENEKRLLNSSLPLSNVASQLDRKPSFIPENVPVITLSSGMFSTPRRRKVPSAFPLSSSPPSLASGSSDPMIVPDTTMAPYMAKADEIDQFLLQAGNSTFFDGEATVDRSLAALGLKNLFTALPGMKICLMSHQVIAVDWMIKQEANKAFSGGCLADEMGLGKTVQMIALMVKNGSRDPKCKTNLVVAPLALLDQWQAEIEEKTDCGLRCYVHHGAGRLKKKADIEKYDVILTTYGTLSAEYNDPEADKDKKKRKSRGDDFVVLDEDDEKLLAKKKSGILFSLDFYRVILDEAHNIRNKRTRMSRAVVELSATNRWCLTGTPIINGLADGYGLLRFLRIRPWYDWAEFNPHIALIEKKQPTLAASRLQAIFRTCFLRRKKDTLLAGKRLIELPPKEIRLVKLEFDAEERAIYNFLESKSQAVFNKYLRAGTVLKNYTQVLVMLLRMRQVCNHPTLITDLDATAENSRLMDGKSSDAVSEYNRAIKALGPNWVAKMVAKVQGLAVEKMETELQSAETVPEEECPICFDVSTESVVTECTHIFCKECIVNVLNTGTHDDAEGAVKYRANERPCPVCRSPVSHEKLFALKAFEPRIDEPMVVNDDFKSKGGKARKSSHFSNARLDESEEDDDMSDFVVPDDTDEEDYKPVSKKRFGKRRANVVLDSDEAEDYEDVIIRPKKQAKPSASGTGPTMSEHEISTKMKQMMAYLKQCQKDYPDDKVIIISQWTRYLQMVSNYLKMEGFVHVRYEGSMSRPERNSAVRAFMKTDNTVSVLLMSLKCGGVGLNLTRGNRVISLDLSWSAAVEGQSFDRAHRLGQQKTVYIERLVIANSVEDRILLLQERKKALSDGSLGEGNGQKIGKMSVKDLANLFGLDHRGGLL